MDVRITAIDELEEGCQSFVNLYEELLINESTSDDIKNLLQDFYQNSYVQIKKIIG